MRYHARAIEKNEMVKIGIKVLTTLNIAIIAFLRVSGASSFVSLIIDSRIKSFPANSGTCSLSPVFNLKRSLEDYDTRVPSFDGVQTHHWSNTL